MINTRPATFANQDKVHNVGRVGSTRQQTRGRERSSTDRQPIVSNSSGQQTIVGNSAGQQTIVGNSTGRQEELTIF